MAQAWKIDSDDWQFLTTFLVQNSSKTTKRDFVDLLASEGRFFPPPKRNVSAKFVSQFLDGEKKMFKINEIRAVTRSWRFKTCTSAAIGTASLKKISLADTCPMECLLKNRQIIFTHSQIIRLWIQSCLVSLTTCLDWSWKSGAFRIRTETAGFASRNLSCRSCSRNF